MITAELDKAQLRDLKLALGSAKNMLPKILASAVNETIKTTNSQIAKMTDLALPQDKVRPPRTGGRNPISKWRWTKATTARPQGVITFPFVPISLIHFRPRDTKKKGVRVKVFKSKGQETRRHSFIATAKNAKHVWGRLSGGQVSKRLPINKEVGPSIKGIVENKPGLRQIVDQAGALLQRRIAQQIDRYLTKP